jgi:hypothetical protein
VMFLPMKMKNLIQKIEELSPNLKSKPESEKSEE